MEIYAWLILLVMAIIFAVVYVLDEIETCRRIDELIKEGNIIIIRF